MKVINIHIDEKEITVDGDGGETYNIAPLFLEKFNKKEKFFKKDLEKFGFNIFSNIFSTDARKQKLNSVLIDLKSTDNLCISISSESQKLHNIPFELINNTEQPDGFLLRRGNISMVRNIPSIDKTLLPSHQPVKILLIISLPLETYSKSPLDPLKQIEKIYDALAEYTSTGAVEIHVEEKSSIPVIRDRLIKGNYDIVHFTGHGSEGGFLTIEDESNTDKEKALTSNELKNLFKDTNVKLFYFDSCGTGKSTHFSSSLAYHIYQNIPKGFVIANLVNVRDDIATETSKKIYTSLFDLSDASNVLNSMRLSTSEDWWKPVLFLKPDNLQFNIIKNQLPKELKRRVIKRLHYNPPYYVYRYSVVRAASNLIEKVNHLVLHGIGGTGKSTLAIYLSKFYDAKFQHIMFFDLKDEEIYYPETLMDRIIDELLINDFITDEEIKDVINSSNSKSIINNKWKMVTEKLNEGKLLLILDNMEETIQDEEGKIKREWKTMIDKIFQNHKIFTIFTTRLKPYLDERSPLDNLLSIREYNRAEIIFLGQSLNRDDLMYFRTNEAQITKKYGFHPLTISNFIDKKFKDLNKVLEFDSLKKALEFYKKYFDNNLVEAKKLFLLLFSFSDNFLEKVFPAEFIFLIKNKLLILKQEGNTWSVYKIINEYFRKLYAPDDETLVSLKECMDTLTQIPLDVYDILNIFHGLLLYNEKFPDKEVEKKIVECFQLSFQHGVHSHIGKEDIDKFFPIASNLSDNNELTAATMAFIGNVYHYYGDKEKAKISFIKGKSFFSDEANVPQDRTGKARFFNNFAAFHKESGNEDLFQEYILKAYNLYRNENLNDLPLDDLEQFRTTINYGADLLKKYGGYKEALKERKVSCQISQIIFDDDHSTNSYHQLAIDFYYIGDLQLDLHEFDEALKNFTNALNIFKQLAKKDKEFYFPIVKTLKAIGLIKDQQENYQEAEKVFLEALKYSDNLDKNNPHNQKEISILHSDLGNLYKGMEEYEKAKQYYENSLAMLREAVITDQKEKGPLIMVLNNLANLHYYIDEREAAKVLLQEAIEIGQTITSFENNDVIYYGRAYDLLGYIYRDDNDRNMAKTYFSKSLEIFRLLADNDDSLKSMVISNLNCLGDDNNALGNRTEALQNYQESLAICQSLANTNYNDFTLLGDSYRGLGNISEANGKIDEAINYYTEAVSNFQKDKNHRMLLRFYPHYFLTFIKISPLDYKKLAKYFCEFLDIYEFAKNDRVTILGPLLVLRQGNFFNKIDIDELKSHCELAYKNKIDYFILHMNGIRIVEEF